MSEIRKVMITGGGGMVGRNLLELPGLQACELLAPRQAELDLRDGEAVRDYLATHRPDLVIHAAGRVGGIQANMAEPVAFLLDNLDMGRQLVSAAQACGVTRLLNLGSSCMYPRGHDEPLREEQVTHGAALGREHEVHEDLALVGHALVKALLGRRLHGEQPDGRAGRGGGRARGDATRPLLRAGGYADPARS